MTDVAEDAEADGMTGMSIFEHIAKHGGMWVCPECEVGYLAPHDCDGSCGIGWVQAGDGYTCPDCGANVADPEPLGDVTADIIANG